MAGRISPVVPGTPTFSLSAASAGSLTSPTSSNSSLDLTTLTTDTLAVTTEPLSHRPSQLLLEADTPHLLRILSVHLTNEETSNLPSPPKLTSARPQVGAGAANHSAFSFSRSSDSPGLSDLSPREELSSSTEILAPPQIEVGAEILTMTDGVSHSNSEPSESGGLSSSTHSVVSPFQEGESLQDRIQNLLRVRQAELFPSLVPQAVDAETAPIEAVEQSSASSPGADADAEENVELLTPDSPVNLHVPLNPAPFASPNVLPAAPPSTPAHALGAGAAQNTQGGVLTL